MLKSLREPLAQYAVGDEEEGGGGEIVEPIEELVAAHWSRRSPRRRTAFEDWDLIRTAFKAPRALIVLIGQMSLFVRTKKATRHFTSLLLLLPIQAAFASLA
jgi:hypothetical protein